MSQEQEHEQSDKPREDIALKLAQEIVAKSQAIEGDGERTKEEWLAYGLLKREREIIAYRIGISAICKLVKARIDYNSRDAVIVNSLEPMIESGFN